MRRAICITAALLGALAAIPGALALPATGDTTAKRVALVRVVECSRGPQPLDRHATFRAAMRRVTGTERMSMRFALQERVGNGGFRTVKAPGLGTWHWSHPSVRRFSYRQRVLELAEGSAYRAVVGFRWHDGDGQVIRRARRRSKACREPGLLPNLRVVRVVDGPPATGAPESSTYSVRVVNRGPAAAPGFGVSLAVDGGVAAIQIVTALGPGEVRDVFFAGPACGSSRTARADPEDAVRETSERDNVLTAPCGLRR